MAITISAATVTGIATDSGSSATDFITNDQTLILSGGITGQSGGGSGTLGIWLSGGSFGTGNGGKGTLVGTFTVGTSTTSWTYDLTTSSVVAAKSLADGTYTVHITNGSATGASDLASYSLVEDHTAASAPAGLDLAAADDSGASSTDNLTNQTSALTISGAAETGATVTLFDDANNNSALDAGETLGTVTASGGAFSKDIALSGDGVHHVRAFQTDVAGNVSAVSTALDITIDTTAPTLSVDSDTATSDSIDENMAIGTYVGVTAHSTDTDPIDNTVKYSLTNDGGGLFTIDANTGAVRTAAEIDRETTGPSVDIEVQAKDVVGNTSTQTFTIAITDVNDGTPAITSAGAFTVAENQTAVGTVVAADGDGTAANNTISYAISGGADAARFAIDADTGALSFAAAPDYEAGQHSFAVTVKASDGTLFSTQDLTVNLTHGVLVNHAPAVTVQNPTVQAPAGQTLQMSNLFSATDADNDPMTYAFYDGTAGGGHFVVNGVTQAANQIFMVSAAQLAQTAFVPVAGAADDLLVGATDGHTFSGWSNLHVDGPVNHAPTVTVPNPIVQATAGQSLQMSSLFTATDADNDTLTYAFYDATAGGGHFEVNGVAQAANQIFAVTAADLANTTFVPDVNAADDLLVGANDGHTFSGWSNLQVDGPVNHAPVVMVPNPTVDATAGQTLQMSGLFNVTDVDSGPLAYLFFDTSAGGGHFEVNGVTQAANQIFGVTAAQLAQTTFVPAANASDDLLVGASDGLAFSGWSSLHIL
jgi:hypothetical protein